MVKDLFFCAVLFEFGLCARGEVWPVVNQSPGPIYPNSLNYLPGLYPPQQQINYPYVEVNRPPVAESLTPRMFVSLVQLSCDAPALRGTSTVIRWIRQGSSMISSAPILVADGSKSLDPTQWAVQLTGIANGGTRSILTLLRPEPESNQAAYFCQLSDGASGLDSREMYILGNRKFVNANLAYHAADTQPRSGLSSIPLVQKGDTAHPQKKSTDAAHHDPRKRNVRVAHNLTLPFKNNRVQP